MYESLGSTATADRIAFPDPCLLRGERVNRDSDVRELQIRLGCKADTPLWM